MSFCNFLSRSFVIFRLSLQFYFRVFSKFVIDLTLKTWVESYFSSVIEVVDANLLGRQDHEELIAIKLSYLSSIMALALACTTNSLEEMMDMKYVVVQLRKITIKLLV